MLDLQALAGSWSSQQVQFFEVWEVTSDTLMEGIGYSMKGADTVFKETLKFFCKEESVFLAVKQGDESNYTLFKLIEAGRYRWVFENKMNEYPNIIIYEPVIIVIVMEKPKIITEVGGRIKKKEYPLMDIGITAEHFCLQATEEGLGTCMLGWFDELAVKELLHVPESKTVPLLITLGYTPDDYKTRKKIRKSFSKLVKWNSY